MLGAILLIAAFWVLLHSLRSVWTGFSGSSAATEKKLKAAKRNRFEDFLLDDKVRAGSSGLSNGVSAAPVTASDAAASIIQEAFENATTGGLPVLVLYGTEYGFSRQVAKHVATELSQRLQGRVSPRVLNMLHHDVVDFRREPILLVVCSTTGDGVVPSDARAFADRLEARSLPVSADTRYGVLALGDRAYPHFCRAGKLLSEWFQTLCPGPGAALAERMDVDQEDWTAINAWIHAVVSALEKELSKRSLPVPESDYLRASIMQGGALLAELANDMSRRYSKEAPFLARMVVKRLLTRLVEPGDKETYHIELDITGSDLNYLPGDALGVIPRNAPDVVRETLAALRMQGSEPLDDQTSVRQWLEERADLKHVRGSALIALLRKSLDKSTAADECELADTLLHDDQTMQAFLYGRELADVLLAFPSARLAPCELTQVVRSLQPRFYSIASSPKAHDPQKIALTVAVVRYACHGRNHKGVATCYLADQVQPGDLVPVFLSRNPNFRLVSDPQRPVVMIGPGTGVAPFRAFTAERRGCTGRTLLFFGSRHRDRDFLYGDEFEALAQTGQIELYTAFSRDQSEKIYVQHRLVERARDLFDLIWRHGAYIYVCGDAAQMARDVDHAIRKILATEGSLSTDQVDAFMQKLEREQRYQRDVWVE